MILSVKYVQVLHLFHTEVGCGCAKVPSWHHGRGCPGYPKVQINAPKQTDRGHGRVPDTTYHQATLPDLVIDHPTSVETASGTCVPLLEQSERCMVRYWTGEIIRMAIQHELNILPERIDQTHVATIREDMIRYANARERPTPRRNNHIVVSDKVSDKEVWMQPHSEGYKHRQAAEDQITR